MISLTEAAVVAFSAAGVFQVYVSVRLLLSPAYTVMQKAWQMLIIWLLPLFGAVFIYAFMQSDTKISLRGDTKFTPDGGGSPPGIGSGGEHG